MFNHFNPETVVILTRAQKAAMKEWEATERSASSMLRALAEASVARTILAAAASGERDPERLKQAALSEMAFA